MNGQPIVYDTLRELGISYKAVEHEPVYTISEMDKLGLEGQGKIAKNLFLRDAKGKRHFLVVLPDDKTADLKGLETALGSTKLSFASENRLMQYLGLKKGAVTPFGVLNDAGCAVEVVFDRDLVGHQSLGVHPNDNSATLFLPFSAIEYVVKQHGNKITYISL